jgi:hypothetical protein
MIALRLTGRLVSMLRRCTPVIWGTQVNTGTRMVYRRGVWMPAGPKADEGMVCWDKWCGQHRVEPRVYAGLLLVDLEDKTGERHALWWLAADLGAGGDDVFTTSLVFEEVETTHNPSGQLHEEGWRAWRLHTAGGVVVFYVADMNDGCHNDTIIPALKSITDRKMALKVICEWVAAREKA